ncbi:TetR/AcrR family transcriptional regulator [Hujiaoplasma nucleasis]|uniref:TetR/AcrR family transcriptional regulator n=1 Tax=Hujiaoplasma nucleasis TaxID=2725268 RepID=A0A7L6N114_9MOLU|nr:TetR/AcrR family transcriptional regulator [Hujiaoplasma nucleasis]QLY39946.1 TetR/AcrR family transcriptional regulator [Hujiaoplasma nucleasis]
MKGTKEKIMHASMKLFEKKGYLETTTLEIAQMAGVAEVTLFRNFNSKLELFEQSIRSYLSVFIEDGKIRNIIQLPSEEFYKTLLNNRIKVAVKRKEFLKFIIKESFSDYLPEDLRFTEIIYKHLLKVIEMHCNYHQIKDNSKVNARLIAGLLLSLVVVPGKAEVSMDDLIDAYIKILI